VFDTSEIFLFTCERLPAGILKNAIELIVPHVALIEAQAVKNLGTRKALHTHGQSNDHVSLHVKSQRIGQCFIPTYSKCVSAPLGIAERRQ
jgi:hypothetical protein